MLKRIEILVIDCSHCDERYLEPCDDLHPEALIASATRIGWRCFPGEIHLCPACCVVLDGMREDEAA